MYCQRLEAHHLDFCIIKSSIEICIVNYYIDTSKILRFSSGKKSTNVTTENIIQCAKFAVDRYQEAVIKLMKFPLTLDRLSVIFLVLTIHSYTSGDFRQKYFPVANSPV